MSKLDPFIHTWFSAFHESQYQSFKDWEEALALKAEREREREIERVRNELIILNRFYPAGGIVAAHPAKVLYYQHNPTCYHPIGTATTQYSP